MSWQWVVCVEGLGGAGYYMPVPLTQSGAALGTFGGCVFPPSRAVLADVQVSSDSWAPVSATPVSSSLSFELRLLDLDDPVARYFLARAAPLGNITAGTGPVLPGATTVQVTSPDTLVPGLYYIGRSRVVVASTVSGSAPAWTLHLLDNRASDVIASPPTTLASAVTGDPGHAGCILESTPVRLTADAPPPFPDDRVYRQNPRVKGRLVYLYRSQAGGPMQLWGIYTLDEVVRLSESGLVLTVSATSVMGALGDLQFGTRPVPVELVRTASGVRSDAPGKVFVLANGTDTFVGTRPDVTDSLIIPAQATLGGRRVWTETRQGGVTFALLEQSPRALWKVVHSEVVVNDATGETSTSYDDFGVPVTHPVVMLLCHFQAGVVNLSLPADWKLTRWRRLLDVEGIRRAADAVPVPSWPGVIEGQEGKPVPALRWLAETFLRPLGLGWAVDAYGRLTVAALAFGPAGATLRQLTSAQVLPGRAGELNAAVQADTVQARSGQGLSSTAKVVVVSDEAYLAEAPSAILEMNAQGAVSVDDPAPLLTLLDRPGVQYLRAVVGVIGEFLSRGLQQYELEVHLPASVADNADRLLLGERVILQGVRGLRAGQDGGFASGVVGGLVVATGYSQATGGTQTIRLQVDPVAYRLIAPALRVATVSAGPGLDEYTLTFTDESTFDADGVPSWLADGQALTSDAAVLAWWTAGAAYAPGEVQLLSWSMVAIGALQVVSTSPSVVVEDLSLSRAPIVGDLIVPAPLEAGEADAEVWAYFSRDRWTP
jgi:hypothetical protein